MTTSMYVFDVLAVRGDEQATIHVEPSGAVPVGTRTDAATSDPVVVIGQVLAANAADAHAAACAEYL